MIRFDRLDGIEEFINNDPFINDEIQFGVMHSISKGELDIAFISQDQKWLMAANPGKPLWIWTDDQIAKNSLDEYCQSAVEMLTDKELISVVAKPEIAKVFGEAYAKSRGIKPYINMSLESFSCPKVIKGRPVAGSIKKAELKDRDVILDFLIGFAKDCFGKDVPREDYLKKATNVVNSGDAYLWDADGEIVSMAFIAIRSIRHARINSVYTPPVHRKKGYAGFLVGAISQMILDEGLTPILFTDLLNPTSNKVYKGVGYIEAGKVTEYGFDNADINL